MDVRQRVLALSDTDLRAASVPVFPRKHALNTVFVFADMGCGHCRKWLKEAARRPQPTNWTVEVIYGSLDSSSHRASNLSADEYAGRPEAFRQFLIDNPREQMPIAGSSRAAADRLLKRIRLSSVPVFLVSDGRRRVISGTVAWELLFHRPS